MFSSAFSSAFVSHGDGSGSWGGSWGCSWGDTWGRTECTNPQPVTPETGWLGGGTGFNDYRQSAEQKRAEREALGIIPPEVKRAIDVIARIEARDPIAALENEAQAIAALARELEQDEIAWRDFYAESLRDALRGLIHEELARRLRALMEEQDEEQVILLMLAEM